MAGPLVPSVRDEFDLPDDVTYLNTAYLGPLSRATVAAGQLGLARKAQPWDITVDDFFEPVAALRAGLARFLEVAPESVALLPSASYGIAAAAANLPLRAGGRVVVLADQFPSNVYPWRAAAARQGATVEAVDRPASGSWTDAVLEALDADDGSVQVVAVPVCHWTDGTIVDLVAVGKRAREVGAALLVDASQAAGAMPLDIADVQPDFLVSVSYKWLLGPYSHAFMYVAPAHLDGEPIEHNWINRADSEDFTGLVAYRDEYQPGARRFDVGEVSNFALVPATAASVDQALERGVDAIAAHAAVLTARAAELARSLGLRVADDAQRSPHLLGVRLLEGMDPRVVGATLADARVYVSVRGDSIRVSAHVFNTVDEVERLFDVLASLVHGS
jgi:selenocysteine lyase/cysteine desulfurase